MSDVDTSREAVERLAASMRGPSALCCTTTVYNTVGALLSRAEQAEAERDAQAQYAANLRQASTNALEDQRAAEAERDAARAEVLEAQKALVDCSEVIIMAGEGHFVDHRYLCNGTLHQLNLANAALAAAPEVSNA